MYQVHMQTLAHRLVEPCLQVLPLWASWGTYITVGLLSSWSVIMTMTHVRISTSNPELIHRRTSPHEPLMQVLMQECMESDLADNKSFKEMKDYEQEERRINP